MTGNGDRDKVHISMVGESVENVVAGINIKGARELYPILSEKFKDKTLKALTERLHGVKIHRQIRGQELTIDPFREDSFMHLVELIIDIVQYHPDRNVEFWVNLTGGTNLMSAAAEAGAVLTRSKAYYVIEGREKRGPAVIVLPWHSLNPRELDNNRIRILRTIAGAPLSNVGIVGTLEGDFTAKSLVHYLKELESAGYLKRNRRGKLVINELTPWGKIALQLSEIEVKPKS